MDSEGVEANPLARIGFSAKELGKIERILTDHGDELLEAWNEYFGQ